VLHCQDLTISTAQNATSQSPLRDPRELYIQNVTLPEPFEIGDTGLQTDFDPRPDCGEDPESYIGSRRLAGRRALITGGDSGIGRAIAIAFAREGADVTINYLPPEQPDADDVQSIIESTSESRFFGIPGDLRNATFCEELVARAVDEMGGLDILINHAGWTNLEAPNITTLSLDVFERTMRTNIFAPFYVTRAAVPYMPPGSSIVFTSSRSVDRPVSQAAHYAASKAFIRTYAQGLSESLVTEHGIFVNSVSPGITHTLYLPTQGFTDEIANAQAALTPLRRVAQPVEVARLYVNLVENAQTYVNGANWEI
jgi:NAD(P)-dependent dehydrogenase (short-subunit alcohol dehydrogenase family)